MEHTLKVVSLRDAQAECSCGGWSFAAPTFDSDKDQYILGRITEAHIDHVSVMISVERLRKGLIADPYNWLAIADAIKALGFDAAIEGGGAACPFIWVNLIDGRVVLFGDNGETWSGQTYASNEAAGNGEVNILPDVNTDVPTTCRDASKISEAFKGAVTDVCIAGSPAILGICGNPECVCAPRSIADVREDAELAFWAVVAKSYPQIETGDLDPMTTVQFRQACEMVISKWLKANTPEAE